MTFDQGLFMTLMTNTIDSIMDKESTTEALHYVKTLFKSGLLTPMEAINLTNYIVDRDAE